MSDKHITRKAGDTLLLRGKLGAENLPPELSWVGAVLRLHVRNTRGRVVLDALVTSFDTATLIFYYKAASTLPPATEYRYEVQVTFSDGTVLTFPNDEHMRLDIIGPVS